MRWIQFHLDTVRIEDVTVIVLVGASTRGNAATAWFQLHDFATLKTSVVDTELY